jgi:hypothetical protein
MKRERETGFGAFAVLTREMLVDAGAARAFRELCGVGGGAARAGSRAPAQAPRRPSRRQAERTAA